MAFIDLAFGALCVFIATSIGSLLTLAIKKIEGKRYSAMLAFSAGVMIYSSVEMLNQSHQQSGDMILLLGFAAGVAVLMASEKLLPHIHWHIRKKNMANGKKKAVLIAGSIAIHNIPEGLSIATAFASSTPLGWFVTTSIALQDIPEGALVSAPLSAYGISRRSATLFGIFSGFIESASAVICYLFLGVFVNLIPGSLAFSSGAMAYVVFVELLPDAMENGMERLAAVAFLVGAAVAFLIASVLAI